MKYADPKVDFTFKRLFGDEHRTNLTINFLNSLLELKGDKLITEIIFRNVDNIPIVQTSKESYLDLRCVDQQGQHYIIEMQVDRQSWFLERAQYYTALCICSQLKKSKHYESLLPVIFIGILDFDIFTWCKGCGFNPEDVAEPISHHAIMNKKTGVQHHKHMEFHYIELSKFKKNLGQLETQIDKWLYFMKEVESLKSVPTPLKNNPEIEEAFELMEMSLWSPEAMEVYHENLDQIDKPRRQLHAAVEEGLKRGKQEGRQEGRLEGLQKGLLTGLEQGALKEKEVIALKLLKKNIEIAEIIELTGLSIQQIKNLKIE